MSEANVSPRRASRSLTWLRGRGERGTPLACQPRGWICLMFCVRSVPTRLVLPGRDRREARTRRRAGSKRWRRSKPGRSPVRLAETLASAASECGSQEAAQLKVLKFDVVDRTADRGRRRRRGVLRRSLRRTHVLRPNVARLRSRAGAVGALPRGRRPSCPGGWPLSRRLCGTRRLVVSPCEASRR
jgi:hypothetical protein